MYGYKVRINSLPKPVWAFETAIENYEWQNRNNKQMLEISFSKFDQVLARIGQTQYQLKNSALSCVPGNEKRNVTSKGEKAINVVSVAVKMSDFSFESTEISREDCLDREVLILPAYLEDLPLGEELELIRILHEMIRLLSEPSEQKRCAFNGCFFQLVSRIDRLARGRITEQSERRNYYVKKVDYMIETRYREKITLQTVSSELNLSPEYVSAMYREQSGISFSKRLLHVRMKRAENLLLDQNIPTAKVAELCGFCDEHYFRKKFKEFFGMNVREYKQIKNGLTLFHAKPQKKNREDFSG